jgi:hypothetical protein
LGTLKENNTYEIASTEILPSLVIELVSSDNNREGFPKEVVSSVVGTIDKEKLASDLEKVVTSVYRYTIGVSGELSATIDLTAYSQTLQKELKPALVKYYEALPTCTPEQEQALAEKQEGQKIDCRLQSKSTEEVLAEFEIDTLISDLTVEAPKTLTITKDQFLFDPPLSVGGEVAQEPSQKNGSNLSFEHIRNLLVGLKGFLTFLLMIIGILGLLLIISRLFNFVATFRWVAWVLVSVLIKPTTVRSNLSSALDAKEAVNYSDTALSLLSANLSDLGQKIFQGVFFQALILIAIAVGLYLTAALLERRSKGTLEKISEKLPAKTKVG